MLKIEMGKVKITYDVSCVAVSLMLSLVFLKRIEGFGIATVFSAIFVGKTLSWLQRNIGEFLRKKVNISNSDAYENV